MFARSRPTPVVHAAQQKPRLLDDFVRELTQHGDRPALISGITSRFAEISGCPLAVFFDWRSAEQSYVPSYAVGTEDRHITQMSLYRRGNLAKWLRVNEEPLLLQARPQVVAFLTDYERRLLEGIEAKVCVPFAVGARLDGVLVLGSSDRSWRAQGDLVSFLRLGARHGALALEVAAAQLAERERLHSVARAQQLAVAGQFASAMAHEVRNPLTTIRSSVQHVLESNSAWPVKSVLLQQVISEVDRINRTITGVLGLSRPAVPHLADVELTDVLDDALTFIQPYIDHQSLKLHRSFDSAPLPVSADAAQLRQVLLNVLLNACQATSAGGQITVEAEVASISRQNELSLPGAIVRIRDTGEGMASAALSRACEPFFTTKATGSGLGLAISLEIMRQHGGNLRLESQLGHGTSVVLTLPLRAS